MKLDDLMLIPLLAATRLMILRAAKRSPRIRTLLKSEQFKFLITTRRGAGGQLVLHGGRLDLRLGPGDSPDFCQVWSSGREALRTMTSKDETAMLRSFEEGRYTMQGRFTVALWFNEVMKLTRNPTAEPGR